VLERALGAVNLAHVGACATFHSQQHTLQSGSPHALAASLNNSMLTVPVITLAELLGFEPSQWQQVTQWMAQFVHCMSPLSSSMQLAAASDAAAELLDRLAFLVDASQPTSGQLLHHVLAHAASCGWTERRALLCNLVGLMSQTLEATAGLIGNTWLALSRSPDLLADLLAAREDLSTLDLQVQSLVNEVCRFDAPIQNTRRFVTQDVHILGTPLPAGAPILLLLGSANRDNTNDQRADELQWNRVPQPSFSFGHGVHACPGRALALVIAATVITQGIQSTPLDHLSSLLVDYRPSVNARIPLFMAKQDSPLPSSNLLDAT
jgi:cytochrome P450